MKKLSIFLCLMCLTAALAVPASAAVRWSILSTPPVTPDYGVPTSFEPVATMDGGARKNEDISKNATLIPPGFGTASADTLNTGTPLTPNLASDSRPATGAAVNGHLRPRLCSREHNPGRPFRIRPLTLCLLYRLHRGHQRPLLRRRAPGDAEDPVHWPERQNL